MKKLTYLGLFISIFCTYHLAVDASELKEELSLSLKKILMKNRIYNDDIGLALIDLESGEILDSFNQNKAFIPASVTKILTTYYALEILGANYQFVTKVLRDGEIKNGVLEGNIYLEGSGDPLLKSAHLMDLALSLKKHGIKKITGKLFYIKKNKQNLTQISNIGLGDQTYNPGISNLSSEFNRFDVKNIKSKKRQILPPLEHIKLQKSKKRLGPGQKFLYIPSLNLKTEFWKFDHKKKYKPVTSIPIRDPSFFTTELFRFFSKKINIDLPPPTSMNYKIFKTKTFKTLKEHHSIPSYQIASLAMEFSNNLLAEQLMLKASEIYKNKPHLSYQKSILIMKNWFKEKTHSYWNSKLSLVNASGLTVQNKTTPLYLSKLLSKIALKEFDNKNYISILSLSGSSGWLKKRLTNKKSSYSVWAKTGSLDYVNNIAGILTTKNGKMLGFSIFINSLEKRMKLENNNSYKIHKTRKKAKAWSRSARRVSDIIIERWLKKY